MVGSYFGIQKAAAAISYSMNLIHLILNKTTDTLSVSLHAVTFQIKMICRGQPLVQEYVWSNAPRLGRYLVLYCIDAKYAKILKTIS